MRKFIAITLPAVIGIAIGVIASNLCAGCAKLKAVETEMRRRICCDQSQQIRREMHQRSSASAGTFAEGEPEGPARVCAAQTSNEVERTSGEAAK